MDVARTYRRPITHTVARRFAERVHSEALDRYGLPLLDHVRRVADAVPRQARTVAWLHETVEHAGVSQDELRAAGADADEIAAVELLTRNPETDAYLAHVRQIANAPGRAGELARTVKRADLNDRLQHQDGPAAVIIGHPAYERALALLA